MKEFVLDLTLTFVFELNKQIIAKNVNLHDSVTQFYPAQCIQLSRRVFLYNKYYFHEKVGVMKIAGISKIPLKK